MSLSTDPITIAAQGIWTVLESHEPLASLVRMGNRIKLDDTNRDPGKANVSTTDLPELAVFPTQWEPTDNQGRVATSNGRFLTVTFSIAIATDKLRTGDPSGIYPVLWEVIRALWIARNTVPGSPDVFYLWPSAGNFELGVRGANQGDPASGVAGWASMATVRVTFRLNAQSLGIDP